MAGPYRDGSREREHPAERDTKIAQALISYAMRGGALYSARRWPENPLTLTHALWRSPDGDAIEAFRPPEDEQSMLAAERDAWIQLAVHTEASAAPNPAGPGAWTPVRLDQTQALELGQRIQQARAEALRQLQQRRLAEQARASQINAQLAPPSSGYTSMPAQSPNSSPPFTPLTPPGQAGISSVPRSGASPAAPPPSLRMMQPSGSPWREARIQEEPPIAPMRPVPPDGARSLPGLPGLRSVVAPEPLTIHDEASAFPPYQEPSGWTGGWRAGLGGLAASESQEVTTLVCIEIDMPMLPGGVVMEDYTRDFARDVSLHFSRAVHTIPQARELRGWMRGGKIVLAARIAVGAGLRAPTRAENEHAAELLADALARRTLPYTQLTVADPAEWAQGVRLPDAG